MANQENKDKSGDSEAGSNQAAEQSPPPTWLSWGIRGFSLAIIIGLIGYLVWDAIRPVKEPTITFSVLQDKIEERGGGWALPVSIVNKGSRSVHTLKVNAALTQVQGEPESGVTIQLMGPSEEVTATFWFSEDPRGKGQEFSVESYLLP